MRLESDSPGEARLFITQVVLTVIPRWFAMYVYCSSTRRGYNLYGGTVVCMYVFKISSFGNFLFVFRWCLI